MAELPPTTLRPRWQMKDERWKIGRYNPVARAYKTAEKKRREGEKRKERPPPPAPESAPAPSPGSASAPAPYRHPFGRELPDVSSRQEIHHCLVALFHGKQLRDLHVSASARFPARHLSHRFPERFLLVSPPAVVAEEVLPRIELMSMPRVYVSQLASSVNKAWGHVPSRYGTAWAGYGSCACP
jgi:hypothetical protein